MYAHSPTSTSVTSKHHFDSLYFVNCSRQLLIIPAGSSLYTIRGLLHFPNENGDILTIQKLHSILPLSSDSPLISPQSIRLLQDKQHTFTLVCQNFLLSTFSLFHPENVTSTQADVLEIGNKSHTLFPQFPITSANRQLIIHSSIFVTQR